MVIKIIQTNLTPGNDFGMFRQSGQVIQMLLRYFVRLVRMNPDRRVNPIVLLGEGQCRIELLRAGSCADGEQRRHSRGARALEHGFAVFRELWKINVRV